MADSKKHLRVRDSRDRLIELLKFGETTPVRDLPILVDRLLIPLNLSAKIPIEETQPDSVYKLWHRTDDVQIARTDGGATVAAEESGTDETIQLESPVITEDQSYRIRAVKNNTGRWAYLHHLAEIKTGLDSSLSAWIRSGELLDPSVDSPTLADPRIVDHGTEVEVEVAGSQEGVDYRLVVVDGETQTEISQEDVRGNLDNIILMTHAVSEDIDIRVLGTRTFDPSEGLPPQAALLDVVLPLKVRANASLTVTVTPGNIIDYQGAASVQIENSESGVEYRLYARTLPDRDFVYTGPGAGIESIATEAGRTAHIVKPVVSSAGVALTEFDAIGSAVTGDGATLNMSMGSLVEDSVVLIQARKQHVDKAGKERPSDRVLEQSPLILVRPDPAPALRFDVVMSGAATAGAVLVSGGQAGVYYYLRQTPEGADLGRPAYFHKRDYDDASDNKGIGQLAIEVDGAVPRASWDSLTVNDARVVREPGTSPPMTQAARAQTAPFSPVVVTPALAVGTALHARAVKAMTGLSVAVTESASIIALPTISVEDTTVDDVRTVNLVVAVSQAGDSYQVMQDGNPIGASQDGDGQDLVFPVTPPGQDTTYYMVVSRPGDAGIAMVRMDRLIVAGEPSA